MKIVQSNRFDDIGHDFGYAYRGYNYDIQNEDEVFLIRIYDDEPGRATVVRPTTMSKSGSLRKLVEFLKYELGVSKIYLYKGDLGSYAKIDLDSLAFGSV